MKKILEFRYTDEVLEDFEKWIRDKVGDYNGADLVIILEIAER